MAASQTFTVLSVLAEAMRVPSVLNATARTKLVWPVSERDSRPVAASQSFTVLSKPADAMRVPSGLNATALTRLVWPLSVSKSA